MFEAVSEALSAKANELCVRGTDMSVDEFLTQHLSKQLLKKVCVYVLVFLLLVFLLLVLLKTSCLFF